MNISVSALSCLSSSCSSNAMAAPSLGMFSAWPRVMASLLSRIAYISFAVNSAIFAVEVAVSISSVIYWVASTLSLPYGLATCCFPSFSGAMVFIVSIMPLPVRPMLLAELLLMLMVYAFSLHGMPSLSLSMPVISHRLPASVMPPLKCRNLSA